MISIVTEYLTAFIIVQICMVPLFIVFMKWSEKYSNYKILNYFLHLLIIAGLAVPLFFLIPTGSKPLLGVDNSLTISNRFEGGTFPDRFDAIGSGNGQVVLTEQSEVSDAADKKLQILNIIKWERITSFFLFTAGWVYSMLNEAVRYFVLLFITGIISGALIFIYKIRRHLDHIRIFRREKHYKDREVASSGYKVYRSPLIPAPFSSGLFFPAVYLPNSLSGEEEKIVLRHEEVHIQCNHILWIWLYELYSSLLWFYPMAGYMKNSNIRLQDLLADKETLETCNSGIYAKTLIKCADILSGWKEPVSFTAGAASGENLKERIKQIISKKSCLPSFFSKGVFIIVLFCVGGLITGFISCSKDDSVKNNSLSANVVLEKTEEVESESITKAVKPLSRIEQFLLQFENPDLEKNGQNLVYVESEHGNFYFTMEDFPEITDIVKSENLSGIPALWPLDSEQGRITQSFGPADAIPPFINGPWVHTGIDISASVGTGIIATADGLVAAAGSAPESWGNYIIIYHDFGISTFYAHLKDIAVEMGQVVKQGESIGTLGNSGLSTGPHLHYAVSLSQLSWISGARFENGIYIDPMKLIP